MIAATIVVTAPATPAQSAMWTIQRFEIAAFQSSPSETGSLRDPISFTSSRSVRAGGMGFATASVRAIRKRMDGQWDRQVIVVSIRSSEPYKETVPLERVQGQVSAESVGDPAVRFGTVAMAGTAFFAIALLLLHALDSSVDVIDHYTSDYALEDYGWRSQ